MQGNMRDNPYQPPGSDHAPKASTPRFRDLVAAIVVAVLAGGSVFLGTCFGSGLILFSYTYPGPGPGWANMASEIMLPGCILLGATTGLLLGRMVYNRGRNSRSDGSKSEDETNDRLS